MIYVSRGAAHSGAHTQRQRGRVQGCWTASLGAGPLSSASQSEFTPQITLKPSHVVLGERLEALMPSAHTRMQIDIGCEQDSCRRTDNTTTGSLTTKLAKVFQLIETTKVENVRRVSGRQCAPAASRLPAMTENRSSSPGVKENAESSSPRSEDVLRNIGINVAWEVSSADCVLYHVEHCIYNVNNANIHCPPPPLLSVRLDPEPASTPSRPGGPPYIWCAGRRPGFGASAAGAGAGLHALRRTAATRVPPRRACHDCPLRRNC